MSRVLSLIAAFVAGLVVATVASWLQVPPPPAAPPVSLAPRGTGAAARPGSDDAAQRVRELERQLARETAAREAAQRQFADLNDRMTALREGRAALPPPDAPAAAPGDGDGHAAAAPPPAAHAAPAAAEPPPSDEPTPIDYSKSELERALIAGGLEAYKATDLKRRSDTLALAEVYLRDQATREGWIDTPRYQEEVASLHEQQVSFRDELGDEGYDKYLFALGQTNRVRVDDVMTDSPAAQAGLATGDMILSYGDTRIFAPDDLVAQTQQGNPGDVVQLLIIRQGKPMTIQVPRGPLGLRINPTQSMPRANDGREN